MTEVLQEMPDVARLSSRVLRVLGQNPGKFTLQGTNTYLISSPQTSVQSAESIPCILVDAAEGEAAYFPLLKSTLLGEHSAVQAGARGQRRHITHILLSHWHGDHVQGLPSLLRGLTELRRNDLLSGDPPRVCKYPNPDHDDAIEESIADLEAGVDYTPDTKRILTLVEDGSRLEAGADATLRLLHTPGHTQDHLSLLLEQESVLFSGDNVLGQGKSVFEDLGAYIASLRQSLDVLNSQVDRPTHAPPPIFPGHGPEVEDGPKTIQEYIDHRMEREEQVLELLSTPSPTGETEDVTGQPIWTVMAIVESLYASYPKSLFPAAARGIFLHLHKIAVDGKARCIGEGALPDGRPPPLHPLKAEYMELRWARSARERL
ncbi:unnamed protein product [Parajaminaea phylloscopi]